VPCEPLSAVRRARPGRLRIKPWILHRRRVSAITTSSPTSHQTVSPLLSPHSLPPFPFPRTCPIDQSNLSTQYQFLSLSLTPGSASTIACPSLPRRPTQTLGTCSTASVSAMPSPTPPQRRPPTRHHRARPFLHLPLRPRSRARPRLYASSDRCSTCRRALPWERVPHLPHHRYPPPVLAQPRSGLLDVFRSARPSRFGPQNITLVPSWFDKSDQPKLLLLGPFCVS
jgi:hypothetical protein